MNRGGGGGGGTLIFSYIHRLGSFFGFKILNLTILFGGGGGGGQKNEYFWGYEYFVEICWGSSQNWTIIRGRRPFLKVKLQNGRYFFGLLKF